MISKGRIKQIRSLELKKNRRQSGLFVAEGHKTIEDFLQHFECVYLGVLDTEAATFERSIEQLTEKRVEVNLLTEEELKRASLLQHPQNAIALFKQPEFTGSTDGILRHELCLALDGVQDPGNLGTILRIADWFGIHHIFCSASSADVFNPKTIQATMGALSRVWVHYVDLQELLRKHPETPVYGTFLDGDNIYTKPLTSHGLIIMGNEGKGISPELACSVTERLFIPNYPKEAPTSESLNVAVATAIVCSEFRRRQ